VHLFHTAWTIAIHCWTTLPALPATAEVAASLKYCITSCHDSTEMPVKKRMEFKLASAVFQSLFRQALEIFNQCLSLLAHFDQVTPECVVFRKHTNVFLTVAFLLPVLICGTLSLMTYDKQK